MNTKAILITGGRAPVALDAARNFCTSGFDVYMAESIGIHICKASNCICASFKVSSPRLYETRFINELIHIINKHKIGLLFPTCEETFYISKHKQVIEAQTHATVYVDNLDKLHLLHNKRTFISKLQELHLPHPETIAVTELSERTIGLLKSKFATAKVITKPAYSRFGSAVQITYMDSDIHQLQASRINPLLFQQFIDGEQVCVYATCFEGTITSLTQYTSSFKAGLGASIHFELAEHAQIESICAKLVHHLSFTGQISFDFIVDTQGQCFPIECNPRATSGLHLLIRSNRIFDLIQSKEPPSAVTYSENCMLILPMLTIGLMSIKSPKMLKQYWQVLRSSKDVLFKWDDPLPFFYQIAAYCSFLILARNKGLSVIEATTYDIEWNGEQ